MIDSFQSSNGVQIKTREACPSYPGLGKIGIVKDGSGEINAMKIGSSEIGPSEGASDEGGVAEVSAVESGVGEGSVVEVGSVEGSVTESSIAEVSSIKFGFGKNSVGKVSVGKDSLAEVGSAEVWHDLRMIYSPLIPVFNALSEYVNVFLVRHLAFLSCYGAFIVQWLRLSCNLVLPVIEKGVIVYE